MTELEEALTALERGDETTSIKLLKSMIESNPKHAEAWSFYGIVLLKKNQPEAIEALKKACDIAPLESRWHLHLGRCLNQVKDFAGAKTALQRAAELSHYAPDAALALTKALIQLGELNEALNVIQISAARYDSPQVHHKHAQISAALHDYTTAISAIKTAYRNANMSEADSLLLAKWHIHVKDFTAAQNLVDKVLAIRKNDPKATILAANLASWKGDFDRARNLIKKALISHPKHIDLIVEQLLLSTSTDADTYHFASEIVNQPGTSSDSRIKLLFALAQTADRHGDYELAWDYATTANRLAKNGSTFDINSLYKQLEHALTIYQKSRPLDSSEDVQQIYFLGPPRCGGSLIQTLLAAAPGVASVGERGALLPWLMPMLVGHDGIDVFNKSQHQLQQADIAGLRALAPSASVYVDKTTHNLHLAGLLQRIHPSAKFVHIERNKKDMALSIYMRNFSNTFTYSYEIDDINRYLDFQTYAVKKWQELGLPILTHNHDDFVKAPESHGKALFTDLGLSWNNSYLGVEARSASVETFSSMQVRNEIKPPPQPKWKPYAKYLASI
ncbi:tetratricopeptide repeat protein [Glaciecola sp. SC05]|uniref:tetratricopeptide repeat-containing sulfotransferase family protein n=1 Tax=Glaciecola sp. SC05 TaxID=1987355 RepID=UPI003528C73E